MDDEYDRHDTADAYGREEGCFQDYRKGPFCFQNYIADFQDTCEPVDAQGLVTQFGLQPALLPNPSIEVGEIELEGADDAIMESKEIPASSAIQTPSFWASTSFYKELQLPLEVPDLGSDPKEDLKDYLHAVARRLSSNVFDQWLPLSPTRDSKDEGLSLPPRSDRLHALLERELNTERISVSLEGMALKQEAMESKWIDNEEGLPGVPKKVRVDAEPITPPLSPVSDDTDYFIPDAEVCIIDLTSEPSSPMRSEEVELQNIVQIGRLDSDPVSPSGNINSPSTSTIEDLPEVTESKTADLKVEVPVVVGSSSSASPSGNEIFTNIMTNEKGGISDTEPGDYLFLENFFDDAFAATLGAEHSRANLMVEQERFNPTDSLSRVPVPLMDFSLPPAKWAANISNAQDHFAWLQVSFQTSFSIPEIPKNACLESELKWAPVPKGRGRISTKEQLDTHSEKSRQLLVLENLPVLGSASYVLEGASLAVLRINKDDEIESQDAAASYVTQSPVFQQSAHLMPPSTSSTELSPLTMTSRFSWNEMPPRPNLKPQPEKPTFSEVECLVKHAHSPSFQQPPQPPASRHTPLNTPYRSVTYSSSSYEVVQQSKPVQLDFSNLIGLVKSRRRKTTTDNASLLPSTNDPAATSKLLSSFMEMRGPKKARLTKSDSLRNQTALSPEQPNEPQMPPPPEASQRLVPVSAPEAQIPHDKGCFIISLSLRRSILRHIEVSWPADHLLDRDYSVHNSIAWSPRSTQGKNIVSPLSFEADVSLTPSVGILVTSLLKAKQRPLPGSKTLPEIRERISALSQKYETLIVLVSEGNPAGEFVGRPSASDMTAYSDFVRFTVALQAGVITYYIPGADGTVARWIMFFICRYAPNAWEVKGFLSATENTWELFLRRAGMNVVAAQVLSGTLVEEAGNEGLARLLAMSVQERLSRYGQLLGGKGALLKASEILDQSWA